LQGHFEAVPKNGKDFYHGIKLGLKMVLLGFLCKRLITYLNRPFSITRW